MGAAQTYAKYQKAEKRKANQKPPLSLEERRALHRLRKEARARGTILASAGRGGLPPSLVINVFRRDDYKCKVHGDRGEGEYGGIQLHHKGGIVESDWLRKKGHQNEINNLVTICTKGHNEVHEKAREEGVDSSQVKDAPQLAEIDTLSFEDYIARVRSAAAKNELAVKELSTGAVILTSSDTDSTRLAILSGLHGEERAGPIAVLTWLESGAPPDDVSLWICPLLSKEAWRLRERDPHGVNYNRVWNDDAPEVVREVMDSLREWDPSVFIDLHEDSTIEDGKPYIHCPALGSWGPKLRAALDVETLPWSKLDKETSESFVRSIGCKNTATVETAQTEDLSDRVGFQRKAINAALNLAREVD